SSSIYESRVGKIYEALVEEINDHDDSMVSARLSNNSIVHMKGDRSLIGEYLQVKLVESKGFYYIGERV
ncbi:MAG: TRAM domain-containing protein, partial [Eubacterium sp.]|nr:TRAM domain-containing protein [Eubacterium sp.]